MYVSVFRRYRILHHRIAPTYIYIDPSSHPLSPAPAVTYAVNSTPVCIRSRRERKAIVVRRRRSRMKRAAMRAFDAPKLMPHPLPHLSRQSRSRCTQGGPPPSTHLLPLIRRPTSESGFFPQRSLFRLAQWRVHHRKVGL